MIEPAAEVSGESVVLKPKYYGWISRNQLSRWLSVKRGVRRFCPDPIATKCGAQDCSPRVRSEVNKPETRVHLSCYLLLISAQATIGIKFGADCLSRAWFPTLISFDGELFLFLKLFAIIKRHTCGRTHKNRKWKSSSQVVPLFWVFSRDSC